MTTLHERSESSSTPPPWAATLTRWTPKEDAPPTPRASPASRRTGSTSTINWADLPAQV